VRAVAVVAGGYGERAKVVCATVVGLVVALEPAVVAVPQSRSLAA